MAPDERDRQDDATPEDHAAGQEGGLPEDAAISENDGPQEMPEDAASEDDAALHPPTEEYRIVDKATLEQAAAEVEAPPVQPQQPQAPEGAPDGSEQVAAPEYAEGHEEELSVEHGEEHEEAPAEEAYDEEHYEDAAQPAYDQPLAPDGVLTPAQGAMPAGMKPPPGFVPRPDEPGDHPPRPHLGLRFLGATLLIVASFAAATSITIINYFTDIAGALGQRAVLTGVREQLEGVDVGEPETILIIGSDKRYGVKGDRGRSDTTILLRLDPERDAISLLSIPRDLKVRIPGHGTDKFNAAYNYGGPRLTLKLVRQMTGLEVNHVVNVDFDGFFYAINAIGCVFVDVDQRYLHSNAGLSAAQQYAEIDIQPGYQRLCGENALAYVRYRHKDNDLVRSARQHDFLREARQKVGPSKLISDRKRLLRIFTRYTSSDIDDPETMIQVMRLLIASRDSEIREVHFPANLGASYVTADRREIRRAVRQFLGIEGSAIARGTIDKPLSSSKGQGPGAGEGKRGKGKGKKGKRARAPKVGSVQTLFDATSAGKEQAFVAKARLRFPVFYPTQLLRGSIYAQKPHVYRILHAPGNNSYPAYKMVMRTSFGEYYGLMGTTWRNPPILKNPSETRRVRGRTYMLYYDNERLRLVAWRTPTGTYWLNNTLLQSLTEKEMMGIATTTDATRVRR